MSFALQIRNWRGPEGRRVWVKSCENDLLVTRYRSEAMRFINPETAAEFYRRCALDLMPYDICTRDLD